MSRAITFSRVFPAYHPRKGEKTNFPEQLWNCIQDIQKEYFINYYSIVNLNPGKEKEAEVFWHSDQSDYSLLGSKSHTVRSGNRWKVGDKFSPRVWSGKPYTSKMITIAPDIEIKKIYDFEIADDCIFIDGNLYAYSSSTEALQVLATNDGLELGDFLSWFNWKPFKGQIICWADQFDY